MPTLRGSSAALESFQTPPAPLPRAREEPLPHRPPGAGKPMMRRVVVIALAAAAVSAGAGAITVGVLSGELVATGSWAGEAAPRMAAKTAAAASAMTRMRRVIGLPAPGGRRK